MRDELTEKIIDCEWEMFVHVNGNIQTASCQTKPVKFHQMRLAQFRAWPEEALESYARDLEEAAAEKRNLLREKYIYMMKGTSSAAQWKRLSAELPPVSERKEELAGEICAVMIEDTEVFRTKYPFLSDAGRPLKKSEDRPGITSIETYQYGELMTYSEKTLALLWDHVRSLRNAGKSFSEVIQANTFAAYGFSSLEEANQYIMEQKTGKARGNTD